MKFKLSRDYGHEIIDDPRVRMAAAVDAGTSVDPGNADVASVTTFAIARHSKPIVVDHWHVEHPGKMGLVRKLERQYERALGMPRRPWCLTGRQRTRRLWRKRGRRG